MYMHYCPCMDVWTISLSCRVEMPDSFMHAQRTYMYVNCEYPFILFIQLKVTQIKAIGCFPGSNSHSIDCFSYVYCTYIRV